MEQIIESIREAIERDCLLPAFITALTIPDSMGQCLYPDLKNDKGKRLAGKQYARWFDEWVGPSCRFPVSDGLGPLPPYIQAVTGKMCWKLRCSLLHSGNYEPDLDPFPEDENYRYSCSFELQQHSCNSLCVRWSSFNGTEKPTKKILFRIDIGTITESICKGAERCLRQTRNSIEYGSLDLLDLQLWEREISFV